MFHNKSDFCCRQEWTLIYCLQDLVRLETWKKLYAPESRRSKLANTSNRSVAVFCSLHTHYTCWLLPQKEKYTIHYRNMPPQWIVFRWVTWGNASCHWQCHQHRCWMGRTSSMLPLGCIHRCRYRTELLVHNLWVSIFTIAVAFWDGHSVSQVAHPETYVDIAHQTSFTSIQLWDLWLERISSYLPECRNKLQHRTSRSTGPV